ncbi:MAG: S16 family serine protease, partial [Methanobacterium sp.]
GSLSVRGDVMPVGGVTGKIEAASEAGMKKVIIPEANMGDVLIEERYKNKIQIIPVRTMSDVLENALLGNGKDRLVTKMKKITNIVPKDIIPKSPKPTIH